MSYIKKPPPVPQWRKTPRALRGFGDGPVTSTDEDDPNQIEMPPEYVGKGDGVVVGEVGPTRVDCDALAPDDPFRKPGQVCAPQTHVLQDAVDWFLDKVRGASGSSSPPSANPMATSLPGQSDVATLALIAVGGIGAYYLLRKKKRST